MRDAKLSTDRRAKQVATETNYARAITRADRHHQLLQSTNNAMVGLACAAVHAIKTVLKSILVDLDFVRALAALDYANANILANFFWFLINVLEFK